MRDSYGRTIDYLRLSVTERCDLRCRYCMEEAGIPKRTHAEMLRLEELAEIGEAAVALGVRKIRLTGGEPLVRRGLLTLCRSLSALPGLEELCLTTNGAQLKTFAAPLRAAGVSRLNISLDSLQPEKFTCLTRRGNLQDTLDGIAAAEAAGFDRLKLNCVLLGGVNDDEIGDFLRLTEDHPWEVRFIELMPMGPCAHWGAERFLPASVILERFPALRPLPEDGGVARRYQLPGAQGTVGLISPLSCDFCARCRRLRVTADGRLLPCLHGKAERDLRGLHGEDLRQALLAGAMAKPLRHHLAAGGSDTERDMNEIGG